MIKLKKTISKNTESGGAEITKVKKKPVKEKVLSAALTPIVDSEIAKKKPEQEIPAAPLKVLKYTEAVGRRKTAVARVRLFTKKEGLNQLAMVNNKPHTSYFPNMFLQKIVESPLEKMKSLDRFVTTIKVQGGGLHAQAEAIRHGLALALAKFNSDFKKRLRRAGFITRDSRMVERKKYGLKKARRAPQWAKR